MRLLASCAVSMALLAAPAAAQTGAPPDLSKVSLEDLLNITITTASLAPEGAAAAPARVRVVTAEQVRRRGYRSLADLLQDVPDFEVDLHSDPDYPAQIVVQGSRGSDRIVVLLDGIRISSPTNEPLPILANFPVHAARQVEIVYGPASALYGADAFSAVINIITREAGDGAALQATTTLGQFGLYDQTASYAGRAGAATVLVAGQAEYDAGPDLPRYFPQDYGDLSGLRTGTFNTIFGPMTSPIPVSPRFSAPARAGSLQVAVGVKGWHVLAFTSRERSSTAPATRPDDAVYNAGVFNQNTLFVGSGSYTRRLAAATSTTTVTYSRHQLDPQSGYWNLYSGMTRSYKYAFGSMLKAEEQVSWRPAPPLAVTLGGTAERFFSIPQGADLNAPVTSRNATGTILNTTIPDQAIRVRYANTGVFAQAQYTVTPALSATVGARFDYNTRYGATLNPRAGIVFTPTPRTRLKVLAGQAYLAPSPYQAYAHYGSFYSNDGGTTYTSPYWHLGNPDLEPQRKTTLEVSVATAVTSGLQVSLSGFASRFTHLIKEIDADRAYPGTYLGWPVDYIDFPVNEGRERLYGGTAGVDYLAALGPSRRLSVSGAISFVDGRVEESDPSERDGSLPAGGLAPLEARLAVDLDWGRWSVAPRLLVDGRQRLLAAIDAGHRQTLPGFARIDVNLRRQLTPSLSAFAGVENLLDARYYAINARAVLNPEELVGAPQNPRRLSGGIAMTFGGTR